MCGEKLGMSTKRTGVFWVFLTVALLVGQVRAGANYTMMGNVNSYAQDNYNVTFHCDNGVVRLSLLAEDLVRVHMAPGEKKLPTDTLHENENGPYFVVNYTWPGVGCEVKEEFDDDMGGEVYVVKTGKVIVKARKKPFKLAFYDSSGKLLVKEKSGDAGAGLGYDGAKVFETMELPEDEHFFGFGAHNHPHDMRGQQMICSATELQGKGVSGGFPSPFFLSTRGYGLFFNNLDDDVTFEMGTTKGEYSFSGTSGEKEGC